MSGTTTGTPGFQETGDFLAALAHELRGPLGAIDAWARALSAGTADAETTRRGLAAIVGNVRAQARLIDDVEEVSRTILGDVQTAAAAADPLKLVKEALDLASEESRGRDIQVVVAEPDGGILVAGDSARLRRLLATLLRHALHVTPDRGQVALRVRRGERHAEIVIETGAPALSPHARKLLSPLVCAQGGSIDVVQEADGAAVRTVVSLPLFHGS